METWQFSTSLFAQATNLGTKKDIRLDPPSKSSSAIGAGDVFQMVIALAVVLFLLKFAVPKLVGKFGKRTVSGNQSGIQIEESAAFGTGHLNVVSVRGRSFLLAVTPTAVSFLADVTGPVSDTTAPNPAFFELLDSATAAEATVDRAEPTEEVDGRRSRLEQLLSVQEEPSESEDVRSRIDRLTGRQA